jgi:hypothetical protein
MFHNLHLGGIMKIFVKSVVVIAVLLIPLISSGATKNTQEKAKAEQVQGWGKEPESILGIKLVLR